LFYALLCLPFDIVGLRSRCETDRAQTSLPSNPAYSNIPAPALLLLYISRRPPSPAQAPSSSPIYAPLYCLQLGQSAHRYFLLHSTPASRLLSSSPSARRYSS